MAHARNQRTVYKTSTTLSAVAFQDHIVKSLNLNSKTGVKSLNHPLPVKKKKKNGKNGTKKISVNASSSTCSGDVSLLVNKSMVGKEYVINHTESVIRKNQSLAERFGILENKTTKDLRLSERHWDILKRKALLRNDLSSPCSICKEAYTMYREQILLSCSHSFHRKCLAFFEKFSGKSSCPLCRKSNYEKRVIYDGARFNMTNSAIKIQSEWRSYSVRKKYLELIKDRVPNDANLKKKFFKSKFLDISGKLVESYENHNEDVSVLLETIDNNIATNQSIMDHFERLHLEKNWDDVQIKAIERENDECPICLSALNAKHHKLVLLSCSHMYHSHCLLSYEKYCEQTNNSCPLCRTSYSKRNCSYVTVE